MGFRRIWPKIMYWGRSGNYCKYNLHCIVVYLEVTVHIQGKFITDKYFQKFEDEKIISQIVGISKGYDQNGDRVC